jgi:hypothetical protein
MRAALTLSLLVLCALAFPARAGEPHPRQSLDRVLPEIRRTTPGTFYDAEGPYLMPDGQVTYRIKWMTPEGRIIWFFADARNGHVLGLAQQPPLPPRYRNEAPPGRFRDGPGGDGRDNGWRNGNDANNGDWRNRDDRRNRDERWNRDRGGQDRGGQDRGGWGNNRNNGDRGGRGRHPGG